MSTIAAMAKMRKPLKYETKYRNRCRLCGRPRAFYRDFGLLQNLFQKTCALRRDTGCHKVKLVKKQVKKLKVIKSKVR